MPVDCQGIDCGSGSCVVANATCDDVIMSGLTRDASSGDAATDADFWSPDANALGEWLQIDLSALFTVNSVVVSCPATGGFVRDFYVTYSMDATEWQYIRHLDNAT